MPKTFQISTKKVTLPFAPYQQPGVGVQVCPDFPFPGLPWPVTRYVPAKSLLYLDV